MPDPTADEIETAAAQTAADGVASASQDGRSATAIDPTKQLDVADRIRNRDALAGTNAYGGPVSAWTRTRMAKAVRPGCQ